MDDKQFRQLLNHFGYSWKGYRRVRKGVKRRIGRHMQQLACRNTEEYLKGWKGTIYEMASLPPITMSSGGLLFKQ